jgi:TetR/AcrR family transcriptional regulator, transcriptional repressor for nem operon
MAAKSDARQRMVEAALDLFHRQGVNATSVDQVLAQSGTGKGQFSHYFKSKDGLTHAVLQFLTDAIRGGHVPTGYDVKSWKDLENWFQQYIEFQKSVKFERSCPIGTIGNDVSNDQELLRQDVKLFLEWSRGQLAKFFLEKKASGELVSSAKPEALADFCISIMQGGMLLTKMKRDTDMFENAASQALAYIKSLRVRS